MTHRRLSSKRTLPDARFVRWLAMVASIFVLMATALAMMLLAGCTQALVLPQGCGDDTLQAIPRNATPAERQAIEWSNNDHACKCGLESCPDYGLPS